MKREIKFRAWDEVDKVMRSWTDLTLTKDQSDDFLMIGYPESRVVVSFHHNHTLMQYTGLKDKEGNEIYEGDIICVKDHAFQRKPRDITGIYIDGYYPVNYTERMELCAGDLILYRLLPYVTVAGNIYENPELLEQSNAENK